MISWIVKLATGNPVALLWIAAGIAAASFAAGGATAWTVQGWRLDACKSDAKAFKAETKALGEAAEAKTKAEIDRQAKLLKETEAKSEKLKSDLAVTNKRLRDARTNSRILPPAPQGSAKPDLACFDRTELESALRRFDEGATRIVDEGSENTLSLKLSVDWAATALKP